MEPVCHKVPKERGQYKHSVRDMADHTSFESVAKLIADNIKIGLKVGWGLDSIVLFRGGLL